MTISVAVCTYQGARWLGPFLASVSAQERLPDEMVVSDDGSDDGTAELVEAFARTVPFPVRFSTTPDRLGSTQNFARVFEACGGDLIAAADQDDLWVPSKLARLERELGDPGIDLVFTDGTVIDADGRPTGATLWQGVGFGRRERKAFERDPLSVLIRRSVVTGAAMVFRRGVLDVALPFPAELGAPESPMLQDRWMALLLAGARRVRAVPEPLICFRQHTGQQTGLRSPTSANEVRHQLRRTSDDTARTFTARARQLAVAAERVGDQAGGRSRHQLEAGARLLERRATLPSSRPARLRHVAQDVAAGRYRHYGGGWRSAIADLARPAR